MSDYRNRNAIAELPPEMAMTFGVFLFFAKIAKHADSNQWMFPVVEIREVSSKHGFSAPKSLQLLDMHALTGCDGTSYPYAKGKVSALKTILAGDFSDLDDVLGEDTGRSDEGGDTARYCK